MDAKRMYTDGFEAATKVGVNTGLLNEIYGHQKNSMWCWAACIATIASALGISVSQEDIVADVFGTDFFGRPCDCPASDHQITHSLGICVGNYCINGEYGEGFPDMGLLVQYLREDIPVIITYDSYPGMRHAVLLTSITYSYFDGLCFVHEIVLRDPAPDLANVMNKGRRIIRGNELKRFIPKVRSHWFVDVATETEAIEWLDFSPAAVRSNPVFF